MCTEKKHLLVNATYWHEFTVLNVKSSLDFKPGRTLLEFQSFPAESAKIRVMGDSVGTNCQTNNDCIRSDGVSILVFKQLRV